MEYHNPTLRVLRILELIDANSGGLSLTEIANLLDLPKGTISPILKTLAATNYVVTDGSLYKIGPHTFELGLSYASGQNARSMIRSEMRSIVSQVDEVCQMGVLVGQDVHYLLKEEGHAIISIISDVGRHLGKGIRAVRGCRVAVHDYVIFLHTQDPSYLSYLNMLF